MSGVGSQIEPKKRSKRFYVILTVSILLLATIIAVAIFEWSNLGQTNYGPGPVNIEITADKSSYIEGEEINFAIHVSNPQDWSVQYPLQISYQIENSEVMDGVTLNVNPAPSSTSAFSPHSTMLFDTYVWDQKTGPGGNRTQVQPGNYTLTVSFARPVSYGDSGSCTIEVLPAS